LEIDRDAFGRLSWGAAPMVGELVLDGRATLEPVDPACLPGFEGSPLLPARCAFHRAGEAIAGGVAELRPAMRLPDGWRCFFAAAAGATPSDEQEARRFFMRWFRPFRVRTKEGAFFTGYYEPELVGSLVARPDFAEPIRGRPDDLVTFPPGECPLGPGFAAGRRGAAGSIVPFPTRKEIESGGEPAGRPLVWVRDAASAFQIHVQGSARIRLPDGALLRLTYAGRNGRPYSSIGKCLISEGHIASSEASPGRLYEWVRARGLAHGEAGRAMLQTNESYIFFAIDSDLEDDDGPIGAAALPLTPLASLAVDRTIWPYGLPYWISGSWSDAAGRPFARMMIGQDTGTAIVGAARGDIFFGSGDAAGDAAGEIRHGGDMYVLLPEPAAATGP
jgi:membrane-bound lytic murein transglycosylase A